MLILINKMVARVKTFTFSGVEIVDVSVEAKLSAGMVAFNIVGLPDKAINEAKERIRSAIYSIGLSFPAKRLTINLSPADVAKEGSYLDLPMAIALLVEMEVIPQDVIDEYVVLGELSLDGTINAVNGILLASIGAKERNLGIICPKDCASEALWAGEDANVVGADNLLSLINHLLGNQFLEKPSISNVHQNIEYPDLKDVYGQQIPKRALEIAAAGGHNLLMIGPPGTGKSMLAQRLPGILPDLTPKEILETNIINSISGNIKDGKLLIKRPFLDPHHSCSMPAMVGGGSKPKPGQISLAHNGVLFLDELPEFSRQVLDSLRQPLETGRVSIARATANITYPAEFQLIGAMNPCRCGNLGEIGIQCKRAPICAQEYQNKISGPLLDRFDLFVDVPKIDIFSERKKENEDSATIKNRVIKAREIQQKRYKNTKNRRMLNATADSDSMKTHMVLDDESEEVIKNVMMKYNLSLRSYSKILKVSRTIADLDNSEDIKTKHIMESLMYKKTKYLV